jgi:hypothetical protein
VQSALNHAAHPLSRSIVAGCGPSHDRGSDAATIMTAPTVHSVFAAGFIGDATGRLKIGDGTALALSNGETIVARVVDQRDGRLRCDFAAPLDPSRLQAARAQCRLVEFDSAAPVAADVGGMDRSPSWPLPARAAIAIGGAAAFWGLIGFALR